MLDSHTLCQKVDTNNGISVIESVRTDSIVSTLLAGKLPFTHFLMAVGRLLVQNRSTVSDYMIAAASGFHENSINCCCNHSKLKHCCSAALDAQDPAHLLNIGRNRLAPCITDSQTKALRRRTRNNSRMLISLAYAKEICKSHVRQRDGNRCCAKMTGVGHLHKNLPSPLFTLSQAPYNTTTMANKAKLEALLTLINTSARDAIALYEQYGDVPAIDQAELHPLDSAVDQVALKSAVRILEGACAQICTTLAPPAHTAINLVQVYDHACVRVVARERVSDILLKYPKGLHVNELAKKINVEPKKLARIMRLLATRGCYNEVDTDVFANNRLSLILLEENPVKYMILLHVDLLTKGGSVFYETLKDPKIAYSYEPTVAPVMYAIDKNGTEGTIFDWMARHDGQREAYHTSMRGLNGIMGSLAVLAHFPFEKYSTVVDVGGGVGAFSLPLAKTHKNVKITIHDLPEALVQTRDLWAKECPEALAEDRVEFEDLNFFEQVPVKGKDIYYLRNIIHDWPDHESTIILSNIRKALGPNSRVLIHDYVLRQLSRKQAAIEHSELGVVSAPEPLLANFGVGSMRSYQQDMTMLFAHNAKERTLQDFLALTTVAGLKLEKVWDLAESCVMEYSAA